MYPRGRGQGNRNRNAVESGKIPNNETDLQPYRTHWLAGNDHYDYNNPEENKCQNRVMLVGRPQLGKTGVFLYLWYLLWKHLGKPQHTGPQFEGIQPVDVEELLEEEESIDSDVEEETTNVRLFERYPNFEHIKAQTLKKPCVSKTYGDPNDAEILKYYQVGSRKLHPSVANSGNRVMKRLGADDDQTRKSTVKVFNKFISRSLQIGSFDRSMYNGGYTLIDDHEMVGKLFIHRSHFHRFWKKEYTEGFPSLVTDLLYPPIIIPSRGRWSSGLLDLELAMEKNENYIQIVVIYEDEAEQYQQHFANYPKICFFVISKDFHQACVGCSRHAAKLLAHKITRNLKNKFAFFMDDNILCWDGITLKGDPDPQFEIEALGDRSQRTHISLFQIMEYFKELRNPDKCSLGKFSLVGFLRTHKNIENIKRAFLRRHVHVAVLMNLDLLKDVHYNHKMIAMEDMDFNFSVHSLSQTNDPDNESGVLVKCLRMVAVKKFLPRGGVSCEYDKSDEPIISVPKTLSLRTEEEEDEQIHNCKFCDKIFADSQDLYDHLDLHLQMLRNECVDVMLEKERRKNKSVQVHAETLDVADDDTMDVPLPKTDHVATSANGELHEEVNQFPDLPSDIQNDEDMKAGKRKHESDESEPGPSGAAAEEIPPPTKTPKKSLKEQRLEKAAKGTKGLEHYFPKRR